jgi:hypothetical protein
MTVMLLKEDQHGLIEDMYIAKVGLLGGPALIVDDGIREIPVLPSTL